ELHDHGVGTLHAPLRQQRQDLHERAGLDIRELGFGPLYVVVVSAVAVVVSGVGIVVPEVDSGIGLVFSVWNLSHMPTLRSSTATASEGCAPLRSHASARSSLISITEGSSSGWYFPMISMNLPSRGLR